MFLPCLSKVPLYVFAMLSGSLENAKRLNSTCRLDKTPISILLDLISCRRHGVTETNRLGNTP